MKDTKTVIVIGAGASKEAKLPDGGELTSTISGLLRFANDSRDRMIGDKIIFESIRRHATLEKTPGGLDPYLDAASAISDAMPQAKSIDNYIDMHNDNKLIELCGKLAITRAILDAESKSQLYVEFFKADARPDYQALSTTWFNTFFQTLTENCRAKDLEERVASVVLIAFNYDRCIEHFLYHSFQNVYLMSASEAADLVNGMTIYHPYGVVGYLDWQKQKKQIINFGITPSGVQLLELAPQIRTFTEGTDEKSSEILAIRQSIADSPRIVFLGFAFHHLNLVLLFNAARTYPRAATVCYATGYGISKNDIQVIRRELNSYMSVPLEFIEIRNDLKCGELLKEYGRSLSFIR